MVRDRRGGLVADGGTEFVTERRPGESIAGAILRGLSAVEGVDELDLEPLYDRVEVSALESMVDHANDRGCPTGVEFTVQGYAVLVIADGTVRIVEEADRALPASGSQL